MTPGYRLKSTVLFASMAIAMTWTPLHAQEVIGTINATLGDEQRTWFAISEGGESQSFFLDQGPIKSASIWGNPTADVVATQTDTLMVDFTFLEVGGTTRMANSEVAWFSISQKDAYRSQEGGVTLSLDNVEEEQGGVRVVGNFEATLAFSSDYGDSFDASDTKLVTGSFDVVLSEP